MLTHDTISDRFSSRQIIYSMFRVLSSDNQILRHDTYFVCNLVNILRAFLHLNLSPSEEKLKKNWARFVSNERIGKEKNMHVKQWSQWMLAELGAPKMLVALAAHDNPIIKLVNLQFGTRMLEGGNRLVQDTLVASLKEFASNSANSGPSSLIACVTTELSEARAELCRLLSLPFDTTRKELHSLDLKECSEAIGALGFWQALVEGHHRGFQEFVSDGITCGIDIFKDIDELLSLTIDALRVVAHPTILKLLQALFRSILDALCFIEMTVASGWLEKSLVDPSTKTKSGAPPEPIHITFLLQFFRFLTGMGIVRICKLLYDIDRLYSEHAPHFVDIYDGNPPGTFVVPPMEINIEPEQIITIKEEIYFLLSGLVDGSHVDVSKNLMMHLNPLCLLRDMFKVTIFTLMHG